MDDKIQLLKKYNFWDGNMPPLGFLRKSYTDNILSYSNNKLIKVIVGQRRAGKSYILRQIADELMSNGVNPNNVFYFNKEFIDFDFVRHYSDLEKLIKEYKAQIKPKGKIYLLLDEIQNIAEWERFVNSYSQDYTAEIGRAHV